MPFTWMYDWYGFAGENTDSSFVISTACFAGSSSFASRICSVSPSDSTHTLPAAGENSWNNGVQWISLKKFSERGEGPARADGASTCSTGEHCANDARERGAPSRFGCLHRASRGGSSADPDGQRHRPGRRLSRHDRGRSQSEPKPAVLRHSPSRRRTSERDCRYLVHKLFRGGYRRTTTIFGCRSERRTRFHQRHPIRWPSSYGRRV